MIYNVAQLLKSPVGTRMDVELDDADKLELKDEEAELAGPVTGKARLHRTNLGIYVDGTVTVPVRMECTRCLKEIVTDMTFPLREDFYPVIDIETGLPMAAPTEPDTSFPINEHHEIDLREAIRQNLVLALPIQILCREDCAGLCPQCGKDLNDGPCNCQPEPVDERFSALRQLLEAQQFSEG